MNRDQYLAIYVIVIVLMTGCRTEDGRVAAIATAAAERQAQQSTEMTKAHANLTLGARELVESAGRSQESIVAIQRDLERQQAEIGRQRDLLEKERQLIAAQRLTDPAIANAILQIGLLVVCVLPLVICWYVLRDPSQSEADRLVAEILIEDLTAEQPTLLPSPEPNPSRPRGLLPRSN